MAASSVAPLTGAVVLGSYLADYNAFRLRFAQGVEGVTPFGSNKCSKNMGAGTPDMAFSISAAILAHTSATKPGLDDGTHMFTPNGVGSSGAGTSSVFTLSNGITFSCDAVVADVDLGAARMRAAIPIAISGKNAGEFVEAWAVL